MHAKVAAVFGRKFLTVSLPLRYKRKEGAHVGGRDKRRLPFQVQTEGRGTRGWERQKKASVSGTRKLDQVTTTTPCYHATRLLFRPASHHFSLVCLFMIPVCSCFALANNFSPAPSSAPFPRVRSTAWACMKR